MGWEFSGDVMSWTLAAALLMVSGVPSATAPVDPSLLTAPEQEEVGASWQLAMRVTGPLTTTDPQHVGFSFGVGRSGVVRTGLRYQPAETSALGFMHGTAGFRLVSSEHWTVAADVEHSHVWSSRKLYRTGGFQFEGHDRRWVTLGVLSVQMNQRRWFGLVDGFEVGAGRMAIRNMVAGRDGSVELNAEPVLILKSAAPVGMVGITLSRPLFWGLRGQARVRVIGAGNSRGGVVPFAHTVTEWEVSRALFSSSRYGRGELGLVGTHSTTARAATYYQNGVGISMKIAF
jgi:hypothetical protein